MKKILTILLAMVMALSLTACGEGKTYAQAEALLGEGKNEEALEIFQSLGDYKDSAQRSQEIQLELQQREIFEGAMTALDLHDYSIALEELQKIPEFGEAPSYLARFHTVEITEENWQEYFELKNFDSFVDDEEGHARQMMQRLCVVMKQPYYDQLCISDDLKVDFVFNLTYGGVVLEMDPVAHTYQVTDQKDPGMTEERPASYTSYVLNDDAGMEDGYRKEEDAWIENALLTGLVEEMDFGKGLQWKGWYTEDPELLSAEGSITLFE